MTPHSNTSRSVIVPSSPWRYGIENLRIKGLRSELCRQSSWSEGRYFLNYKEIKNTYWVNVTVLVPSSNISRVTLNSQVRMNTIHFRFSKWGTTPNDDSYCLEIIWETYSRKHLHNLLVLNLLYNLINSKKMNKIDIGQVQIRVNKLKTILDI